MKTSISAVKPKVFTNAHISSLRAMARTTLRPAQKTKNRAQAKLIRRQMGEGNSITDLPRRCMITVSPMKWLPARTRAKIR